jgi:xanthine dehydrogenase YagR molybdenum-binding subunit
MSLTERLLGALELGEAGNDVSSSFAAIGRATPRVDGPLKVTGRATFTAEWQVPNVAHAAVVDSAIARGTIVAIDSSQARALPGVIAVVTHENAPRLGAYPKKGCGFQLVGEGGLGEARQPLQGNEIFYGAQSIAIVVAESADQARYGATLVKVSYDQQPPELNIESASRKVKPRLFAGEEPMQRGGASVRAALEQSAVRIAREYQSPVHHHNPIEILGSIAMWDQRGGKDYLTLYDTTRAVDMLRQVFSISFAIPEEQIQIISKFIGGAFGSKAWTYHNPLLVALAAKMVNRPVRLEWRRQQVFSVGGHRPSMIQRLEIGADRAGRLAALQHDSRTHSSMVSGYTEFGGRMTKMMYDVPELGFSNELVHLNLPTPSVMRGPGFLIGGWALETALDELACELRIDPIELRLRNYADRDPASGLPFSNKHLRECYTAGKERFGWSTRAFEPRIKRLGRDLIGYGMASCAHPAGQQEASAEVKITSDGRASARSATHELGNGSYTIFRQITADGLAMALDRVSFDLGDTSFPTAAPTHGSITTATVGPAVFDAAQDAVEQLKKLASADRTSPLHGASRDEIEANDSRLFLTSQPVKSDAYADILHRAGLPHVVGRAHAKPGIERLRYAFYSFGAVFAEVRVDEATGVVRVTRLCGVYDCGRLVNPRTAHSQLMGGMLFGLGAALTEETIFDRNNGLPVIRNLADYHVPSCADTPQIIIDVLGVPDPHIGSLGAHGVGELGPNGVPPAIGNAIYNATGKRLRSLPYTPDKFLEA